MNDTLSHKYPKINFYETYTLNPDLINFGENGLFMAFSLENDTAGVQTMNLSFYEISLVLCDGLTVIENISLIPCNNSHLINPGPYPQDFQNFLNSLDSPDKYYCL